MIFAHCILCWLLGSFLLTATGSGDVTNFPTTMTFGIFETVFAGTVLPVTPTALFSYASV